MPTWFKKLDLKTLDISSCTSCVCGQIAQYSRAELGYDGIFGARDWSNFAPYLMKSLPEDQRDEFFSLSSSNERIRFSEAYGFLPTREAVAYYDSISELDEEGDTDGTAVANKLTEQMWAREVRRRLRDAEVAA